MATFELQAQLREVKGTGASRRLRRLEGITPGIVYGGGKEPTQVTLALKDLNKSFEDEGFFSHVVKLNISGTNENVLIKAVQRHAFKPVILHVDFQRVSNNTIVKQNIPLHFINEDVCKGVKLQGGKIAHVVANVMVICEAGKLPEFIEVDLADIEVGTIVHMSDLKLPEGVQILELTHGSDHDAPVVSVDAIKGGAASTEEAEAAAE